MTWDVVAIVMSVCEMGSRSRMAASVGQLACCDRILYRQFGVSLLCLWVKSWFCE